ncbi:hypothetical protein GGH12_002843 [Coemansia sp. RSA 1822]|nr:hypothetical protein GGH12_002843 [Coemansia sp. RSA 1822]
MALSLTATFRTVNIRSAHLAARQPAIWRMASSASANARVQLASVLSSVQQAQPLVSDLRLQIRALSCSSIIGDRVPGDKGASASDTPVSATPVSDPNGNQLAQGQKWTRSSLKHGKELPYPELKKWYIDAIAQFEIPTIANLVQLLNKAQKHGDHEFLDTVIRKDFSKLLGGLKSTGLDKTDRLFKYYKSSVWSCAISSHVSRKEVDKAMEYFSRIINAGTFPAPTECVALLKSLEAKDIPFPVLPMKLNKTASAIRGMKPAYPPRSESSCRKSIKVESPAHRTKLRAQMGLSMLYSLLQHKQWPTDYFYGYLLVLLARAQMISELKHIFKVVMPATKRNVERLLELDQLREQDKLPRPFSGVIQMLKVFTGVEEHFDMDKAEALIKATDMSFSETQKLRFIQPGNYHELAMCYKMMVDGYLTVFLKQKEQLGEAYKTDSGAMETKEHIKLCAISNYRVPSGSGASMAGSSVSDLHGNQLAQGQKWTRSSLKHGKELPYPELKKWYTGAIAQFEIPTIANLVQLLNKAQKHGDHEFWETVERLLELDQLREQDKLPRPFSGVIKLLKVFTGVDEYFDMDKAEALIKDTDFSFSEPQKSRFIQPEDYSELAWCYRLMVEGYLAIFKKQKEQLD